VPGNDDIVDAEIVEESLLPAVRGGELELAESDELLPELTYLPPGVRLIPMDYQTRLVVREALGHYHDNGPRKRSTRQIIQALLLMADIEQGRCPLCSDQGYRETMRGPINCSCRKGNERRGI